MNKHSKHPFYAWFEMVKKIAKERGFEVADARYFGRMFNQGLTPKEAIFARFSE